MIDTRLELPARESAPRRTGLTMLIDTGLFTGQFVDMVESVGEYVDLVKFGWCTGLVTRDIKRKIAARGGHHVLLRWHAVRALRVGRDGGRLP
jgi:phosphosulfolactate synthase (CoM biosynthesis protein A)